jgi:hypothetical protein
MCSNNALWSHFWAPIILVVQVLDLPGEPDRHGRFHQLPLTHARGWKTLINQHAGRKKKYVWVLRVENRWPRTRFYACSVQQLRITFHRVQLFDACAVISQCGKDLYRQAARNVNSTEIMHSWEANSCSDSKGYPHFMETQGSVPCSQCTRRIQTAIFKA